VFADANSVAAQAKAGEQKGYVSGNGAVDKIPVAKRVVPVKLKGRVAGRLGVGHRLHARQGARAQRLGILVCAVCGRGPALQQTWADLQADRVPVCFVGIDFRKDPARGAAFATKVGVTYLSLTDESGVAILALPGKAPTVPTTLVLDTQGRDRSAGPRCELWQ
jgi:hypothetical protein